MKVSFGVGATEWVDPATTLIAVLIGAALTWIVTYWFEVKKHKEVVLSRAYSLVFKVHDFTDEITQLERNILADFAAAEARGVDGQAWKKLSNLVGFNTQMPPLTSEELAVIAITKDQEMLMDVREIESGHRVLRSIIDEIGVLKRQLDALDLHRTVEGKIVSFKVTENEYSKVAHLIIGLDELSESLTRILPKISAHALTTSSKIGPFLKNHYGFKHFVQIVPPQATRPASI